MKKKPNIIYVLADDMGYGDVSALNENAGFKTPNFDDLCKNGIAFTDAHATSAVCTPSRYGILTGRYNWRSSLKNGVLGGFSEPMIKVPTIANMLKNSGYKTACIGKWHLGMSFAKSDDFVEKEKFENCDGIDYSKPIKNAPTTVGFDYFYGIAGSLDMPPYVYIENDRFTEIPDHETNGGRAWWRKGATGKTFVHENMLDEICDKVINKIDEYNDNPFFIYFPLNAPHCPILPSERFIGKSGTNQYGDFVLQCDDVLGRVVNHLKENNLLDDTIVVFASDNGCAPTANFAELAKFGHNPNYVFRGQKADIYEGGHRIPYMIRWTNGIKAGQICNKTVCLSDFMATVAQIIGYDLKDNEAVDSFSNLPLWNGENRDVRPHTIHQSEDGSLSIRKGKWKLNMCKYGGGWSNVQEENKALLPPDAPDFELFDMDNDIGERNNLFNEYPEVYKELKAELIEAVKNGRTTKGTPQENEGVKVWKTVPFLIE